MFYQHSSPLSFLLKSSQLDFDLFHVVCSFSEQYFSNLNLSIVPNQNFLNKFFESYNGDLDFASTAYYDDHFLCLYYLEDNLDKGESLHFNQWTVDKFIITVITIKLYYNNFMLFSFHHF